MSTPARRLSGPSALVLYAVAVERTPARRLPRARPFERADALFLGAGIAVVVIDQLTKWGIRAWVDRGDALPEDFPLQIVHYRNTGAAFGILQGAGPLLAIASLAGMAAILIYLFSPGFSRPLVRFGLSLMLGGAIGNLIDRVYAGEVVDFLKVSHWPAFNVADSSITIGVVLLLWTFLTEPSTTNDAAS